MNSYNIATMRFSALGDIAATLPILRALKTKPTIITTVIGKELLKNEFEQFILLCDKNIFSVLKLILEIRKQKFDTIFDFQCNDRTRFIGKMTNSTIINNEGIDIYNTNNVFEEIAKKSPHMGEVDTTFETKQKSYIVLNCGSSPKWLSKRLPIHKWKEIAHLLLERYDLPFILTGDAQEKEYVTEISRQMPRKVEVVAGKTDIQTLKKILSEAFLTVSTDSAPMHISAAQKTPTIGLFGPTNWVRCAPQAPWVSVAYDKTFYTDGKPPIQSRMEIAPYFENIDITEALNKLKSYLGE